MITFSSLNRLIRWLTEEFVSVIVLSNTNDLYFDSVLYKDTVIVFELFLCRSMLLGFIFGSKNLLVILTSSCRNVSAKDSRRFRQFLEKIKLGRIIAQF
ncbi:unnamed protein product [Brugia timori]|uniref:Uncharacterized protein n=1 Tax=Brugia timori TaxID=42155 RepID=A0A3P7TQY2_9BILA|nr:unnamed protein product [Brugia timori]